MKFKIGDIVVPYKRWTENKPGTSSSIEKKKVFGIPAKITKMFKTEWPIELEFHDNSFTEYGWREDELRIATKKEIIKFKHMEVERNI